MATDKAERRTKRKADLEKLTLKELGDIKPYQKGRVGALKAESDNPKKKSKAEMIETILQAEGFGGK